MALGSGVHNLSLIVRAHNRATRALNSVARDLTMVEAARAKAQAGFVQMSNIGLLAIKALAVGTGVLLAGAIVAWSKFDDKMAGSLAIIEDVSPQMREKLEQVARDIAKTTIFSASQAAEAYFHLFSSGMNAAQAMESLPVVAKLAQVGLMDLATATELIVTTQNALGLAFDDPIKNMEQMLRIADVLAKADMTAVGTIEEFADALTNRAAAAMNTYNIELEEGMAVLAAWAQAGLKGTTAGEAFSIVVRDLQKAALKEPAAWRAAGAAVFDHAGNLRNLADIVGDVEKAMESLSDAEKKQLLSDLGFQERSQGRLLQLLGQSDAIREFEAAFRSAGGAVEEVAEKQLDSPIKQLILLKNAVVDLFIGAGKAFDEGFTNIIMKVRKWVVDIGPSVFDFAERAAASMSRAGEIMGRAWERVTHVGQGFMQIKDDLPRPIERLVEFIEKLIKRFKELPQWVQTAFGDWLKYIPVITLMSGGLRILLAVLGLITSPALIVAAALAGIGVAFKAGYENVPEFKAAVDGVVKWFNDTAVPEIGRAVDDAKDWLAVEWPKAWEAAKEAAIDVMDWWESDLLPFLGDVGKSLNTAFTIAQPEVQPVLNQLGKLGADIQVALSPIFEELGINLEAAWGDITGFFSAHSGEIGLIFGTILGTAAIRMKAGFGVLGGVFKVVSGIFQLDWDMFWGGIKQVLGSVVTFLLLQPAKWAEALLKLVMPEKVELISEMFQNLYDFVYNPMETLKKDLNIIWTAIESRLLEFIANLSRMIPGLSFIGDLIGIFNGLGGGGGGGKNAGPGAGGGGGSTNSFAKNFNKNGLGPLPAGALSTGRTMRFDPALQASQVVFRGSGAGTAGDGTADRRPEERVRGSFINIEKIESKPDPIELAREVAWQVRIT